MVQNIAIVGLNRTKVYEVAKLLAEQLDMHFFDSLELFEFDNIPRNLSQMLEEYGEEYYRKKEKGMIGYVSGFTNCVINLESGMAESVVNFNQIKETSILIYNCKFTLCYFICISIFYLNDKRNANECWSSRNLGA